MTDLQELFRLNEIPYKYGPGSLSSCAPGPYAGQVLYFLHLSNAWCYVRNDSNTRWDLVDVRPRHEIEM